LLSAEALDRILTKIKPYTPAITEEGRYSFCSGVNIRVILPKKSNKNTEIKDVT
jgi:hypothetical protein